MDLLRPVRIYKIDHISCFDSHKEQLASHVRQIRPQTYNFDSISINADKYNLVNGDGAPEDSSSLTSNVPKDISFENNKSVPCYSYQ